MNEATAPAADLQCEVSELVWDTRYRSRRPDGVSERSVIDTWSRVANGLAAAETKDRAGWAEKFFDALAGFRFLPAGRVLAGAGTGRRASLFNCFVMGVIEDSTEGIFQALKEGAVTMQQGGGVGYDFSTLRPAGTPASSAGRTASGPVPFLHAWDAVCNTLLSTSVRRGAMMATLRCDHPDIEAFIDSKRDRDALRHFNLSVLVPDAFLAALASGAAWPLRFDVARSRVSVWREIDARTLWQRLVRAAYETGEPGVIFIDRARQTNNLRYCESIVATNPCGEVPLPPYGVCDLGSINLTRFVRRPFTPEARLDLSAIIDLVPLAVRMLDNVYDISSFPLEPQRRRGLATRRVGLGITGLGDALTMLGLRYGSEASLKLAGGVMRAIGLAAYRASIQLAREKGAFPAFDKDPYLAGAYVRGLPPDLRDSIASYGIRNSHLTAIAPTGSISLLAGNVSSGLEPAYAADYTRRVRVSSSEVREVHATDYACALYRSRGPRTGCPPGFVRADEVSPDDQLAMQAELQAHVDNAISKTVNLSPGISLESAGKLYERAYALGLKGCTLYRAGARASATLSHVDEKSCCS